MFIYLRVLKESFRFASNALRNNKLRTFLSLMGVTVGIFSIIGVLAAVDSLERDIKGSLSTLDQNTIWLSTFPFKPEEVPQWKWRQFPALTYEDYQYLDKNLPEAEAMSYGMFGIPSQNIKYNDEFVNGVGIEAVTEGFFDIEALQFEFGRFFNEQESANGRPVVVLGVEIAKNLFGEGVNPTGKRVRLFSRKFTVIGVLEKEGVNAFGDSKDEKVIIPAKIATRLFDVKKKRVVPYLSLKPKADEDYNEFIALIKQRMRRKRALKPDEIDSFFITELKGAADAIEGVISILTLVGWGIGGFSLLVGGFGIANIMFVSVRERTNLIGIQKALGAKGRFILSQFLFESILLSIFGGIIGLILVQGIVLLLGVSGIAGDFEFVLSAKNIILGLSTTFVIGIIAGIIPAISASRLDPVEAIRTGM